MKKALKIIGVLFLGSFLFLLILHKPIPKGSSEEQADKLALKMLTALNFKSYQNTNFLEWSFRNGANQYKWDKKNGVVQVKWKDYLVLLDLVTTKHSKATKFGKTLPKKEENKTIDKAIKMFNNDSFWLVAPYKAFDTGTSRSIVTLKDGSKSLLITYSKGGSTPGDSYLWKLNENGFPTSYQMWVNIIPIGGIEATWDDWQIMESGAFLPKSHKLGPLTLRMGEVKAYNSL